MDTRTGRATTCTNWVSPWSSSAWARAGAFASLRGEHLHVPIAPTTLVDTVGAGDSFHAGLLHHLAEAGVLGGRLEHLTTDQTRSALRFASRVAAINCSRPGADPPWAAEL